MKSLDKLRKMELCIYEENDYGAYYRTADMERIANEIEDEIDEWYLPRPLFEDGEPVQWHDLFDMDEELLTVTYYYDGTMRINGEVIDETLSIGQDGCIPRHTEEDTQEKIDHDATLAPWSYCDKYKILDEDVGELEETKAMIKHLLKRQRKIDGVE